MNHDDYKEMLAAAALAALDQEDAQTLAAHLSSCAECRAELDDLSTAAALLAHIIVPVAPSPDVRARLLTQIKTAPPLTSTGGAPIVPASTGTATTTAHATTPDATVLPFAPRAPRRPFGASPLAIYGALAASIIIAVLAVALATLWARDRKLQTELAQLTQSLQQTQQTLAAVRADNDLLAAPDAHTAELAGTPAADGAHARLTYDEHTGRALLVAAGLPAPPPGKAYQLWFIADGQPLPGRVFTTDTSGRAELREQIPPAGRHAQIFAVTLEPQTGVAAPTGQMYLKSVT